MLIESQYSIPMHASVHTQAHVSSMFVYLTLYNSCFIHTSLLQEHDTQTPAAASRATEEWMLICQRNTDIQCDSNCEENNWSDISAAYPNLEELPVFITRQRQSHPQRTFTTSAVPQNLEGRQLQVYTLVQQHLNTAASSPLRMIVSGTAGTGKSYLIHCLRLLLKDKVRVAAPTGVAAFNIDGHTLHSLLRLPTKGEFKDLQGEHLHQLQQSLANMEYLIIDEMSMVGRKTFGQVDTRLRQCFPSRSEQLLGGCSCLLFGDFGQLPPVMDLPLYTTAPRTALSDLGCSAYQLFHHAVVLTQVMRQSGQHPSQVLFRKMLLRLRDGQVTQDDWKHFMTRTPAQVQDLSPFASAVHLFPTTEAVVEHNVAKLRACGQPIATIKAVHTGPQASKASSDDASGLEAIICLAVGARVMLSANLWVNMGLVNGAMGTVKAICYCAGSAPPNLPVAVTVRFDMYSGPTLPDGTVPIAPLRRTWASATSQCSRLQLPLKLAWAVTIHKAQGLTLDKLVVDIGRKEFSAGLSFVACSRVRHLTDLLLDPPFAFHRLANLANSHRLQERLLEDARLSSLQICTLPELHSSQNSLFQVPSPPVQGSLSLPSMDRPTPPLSSMDYPQTQSPPSLDFTPTPSLPSLHPPTPSLSSMDYLQMRSPPIDIPNPSPPMDYHPTPLLPSKNCLPTPSLYTVDPPIPSLSSMDCRQTPSPPSMDTPNP